MRLLMESVTNAVLALNEPVGGPIASVCKLSECREPDPEKLMIHVGGSNSVLEVREEESRARQKRTI